jgi:hypothetical protein
MRRATQPEPSKQLASRPAGTSLQRPRHQAAGHGLPRFQTTGPVSTHQRSPRPARSIRGSAQAPQPANISTPS